jgi:hypothetical protein
VFSVNGFRAYMLEFGFDQRRDLGPPAEATPHTEGVSATHSNVNDNNLPHTSLLPGDIKELQEIQPFHYSSYSN